MNNIDRFNRIIDYIEQHLTEEIDISVLAGLANMSIYEFRRVFTFIAGIPLGDYIRKRRLSAAAEELLTANPSISAIAVRYGYDSPASFSRSFKAFHGVSPTEVINGSGVTMYTRIDFSFHTRGGKDISYRIFEDTAFWINGISGISDENDTECCENIWSAFYSSDTLRETLTFPNRKIYAAYQNGPGGVSCYIGERTDTTPDPASACIRIPAGKWACFSLNGSDDSIVNAFYEDILFRWCESGNYKRNDSIPNLEVFPQNMESDNFSWEIRIPIL